MLPSSCLLLGAQWLRGAPLPHAGPMHGHELLPSPQALQPASNQSFPALIFPLICVPYDVYTSVSACAAGGSRRPGRSGWTRTALRWGRSCAPTRPSTTSAWSSARRALPPPRLFQLEKPIPATALAEPPAHPAHARRLGSPCTEAPNSLPYLRSPQQPLLVRELGACCLEKRSVVES